MDKIDWFSDESVVVPPVLGILVFVNATNEIVIRQQDQMGDEDVFITFPKSNAKAIAKAINEAAKK